MSACEFCNAEGCTSNHYEGRIQRLEDKVKLLEREVKQLDNRTSGSQIIGGAHR